MKLSEFIAAYGDEQVVFQRLDDCALSMKMDRGTTRITFGTPELITPTGLVKLGLIVWLDREKAAAVIAANKSTNPKT